MNIAFSVVRSLSALGGIEKYTAELGARLSARGHNVTVFCMAHYGVQPGAYGAMTLVPCAALHGKFGEKLSAGAVAAARIARQGFDIVHQHSIAAGAFNWLAGFPRASVLQMHGLESRRTKWGPIARGIVRALECFAVSQYHYLTAVSKTQCRILMNRYGIRSVYIPTATDIRPPAGCDLIRSEYGLAPDNYILFASRLVPEKGAHYLIDAFRNVHTDMRLVIAGDAPTEPAYVDSLRDRAHGDSRVIFTGAVRGEKLYQLFSNCWTYVQPSVIEGLSIALLEAMSFGRCCLVSDIDENREAIGDAGVTFRSEDSDDLAAQIKRLLASPARIREVGDAARDRVHREYSWDLVTSRMEEFYSGILHKN